MLAFVCSRYNDPDPANRRRNLREHDALCRWAIAQGYTPVSPFAGVSRTNPPNDAEGGREEALRRSGELAEWVGCAGGVIVIPTWYEMTLGMADDHHAWFVGQIGCGGGRVQVAREEIERYMEVGGDA